MSKVFRNTVSVPYGCARIKSGKYKFHPNVKRWCRDNLKGQWRVHRTDDPSNSNANFAIDRPVTAAASFEKKRDAALFKLFWSV